MFILFLFSILDNSSLKVWIIGDDHIVHAEQVANSRPGGPNLWLDQYDISIQYIGKIGASYDDIEDMLQSAGCEIPAYHPHVAIVHLGFNDLYLTTALMKTKSQRMIEVCKKLLPTTMVIFSHILPSPKHLKHGKLQLRRKSVNSNVTEEAHKVGLKSMTHPFIKSTEQHLFVDSARLSHLGYEILLDAFATMIRKVPEIYKQVRKNPKLEKFTYTVQGISENLVPAMVCSFLAQPIYKEISKFK